MGSGFRVSGLRGSKPKATRIRVRPSGRSLQILLVGGPPELCRRPGLLTLSLFVSASLSLFSLSLCLSVLLYLSNHLPIYLSISLSLSLCRLPSCEKHSCNPSRLIPQPMNPRSAKTLNPITLNPKPYPIPPKSCTKAFKRSPITLSGTHTFAK